MEMKMKNGLPGGVPVVREDVETRRMEGFHHRPGDRPERGRKARELLFGDVDKRFHVADREDQDMPVMYRTDVKNRQRMFVPEKDLGGGVAAGNGTEIATR